MATNEVRGSELSEPIGSASAIDAFGVGIVDVERRALL